MTRSLYAVINGHADSIGLRSAMSQAEHDIPENAMSMDRCNRCDRVIDTDYDLDCYMPDDECVCESCREHDFTPCDSCGELVPNDLVKREGPAKGDGIGDALNLCAGCHG